MGRAIGDRYLGVGQAVDLFTEVEDHVELAVRGNVGPGLPAHSDGGCDPVHLVIVGLESGMGQ